jgi:uncharacterized protein
MPNFSILLPSAEGKMQGGNPFAPDMFDYRSSNTFNYFNELNPERRSLIRSLQDVIQSGEDLEPIFGVKGDYLEDAVRLNMDVLQGPLMSALDRYSVGVMYKAMDFTGLPTGAQRRLLENGIIFSGLFGLLRPDDLIPNYRLRMDASLPGVGKVSKYWRPNLSPLLNKTVADRFVWNLLPGAHQEAWEDDQSYSRMIEVRFFKREGGEVKAVSHGVKPLRGQLVNFICRESVDTLEPLLDWTHPEGFRFDEEHSSLNEGEKAGVVAMVKVD